MFPAESDPKGDPETWTREELRKWLAAVRWSSSGINSMGRVLTEYRGICIRKTRIAGNNCSSVCEQI
jgi:hypothetical protein